MHASTLRRPVAVASALLLAATLAVAGSGNAAGPRGPHGLAGGPPGPGGLVEQVMAGLKDRLALDSSQLQMFETARAGTIAVRDQAIDRRKDVRGRIDAELAKTEPDLAAIAAVFDSVEDQGRSARFAARESWLRLYANLRTDQKTIVRDAIRERIAHADSMRDKARPRHPRAPS